MGPMWALCFLNPFSRNRHFLGPTLQNFGKIGKTRTKILANLYEIFRKFFHQRIPLTLLCDGSYKREINSLVENFFLVYEKFYLDFAKNRKIRNSKFNPETTPSVGRTHKRWSMDLLSPLKPQKTKIKVNFHYFAGQYC